MLGIMGFVSAAKVPGSVPALNGIIPPYAGEPMAPFAANDNLPFVADMLAWHTVRLTRTLTRTLTLTPTLTVTRLAHGAPTLQARPKPSPSQAEAEAEAEAEPANPNQLTLT